jgi:Mor family transcriptional regulator
VKRAALTIYQRAGQARQAALRAELAPRDEVIASRRRAGESVISLARDYKLTRQAIYDVIARQEKLRRLARKRGRAA